MKWLVDAQLPMRLAARLSALGHDAVHTLDLPCGNRTPDGEIRSRADREGRTVITKDADFVESHLIEGSPEHLLLISTGNIGNPTLFALFESHLLRIVSAFDEASFVELTPDKMVVHD